MPPLLFHLPDSSLVISPSIDTRVHPSPLPPFFIDIYHPLPFSQHDPCLHPSCPPSLPPSPFPPSLPPVSPLKSYPSPWPPPQRPPRISQTLSFVRLIPCARRCLGPPTPATSRPCQILYKPQCNPHCCPPVIISEYAAATYSPTWYEEGNVSFITHPCRQKKKKGGGGGTQALPIHQVSGPSSFQW